MVHLGNGRLGDWSTWGMVGLGNGNFGKCPAWTWGMVPSRVSKLNRLDLEHLNIVFLCWFRPFENFFCKKNHYMQTSRLKKRNRCQNMIVVRFLPTFLNHVDRHPK